MPREMIVAVGSASPLKAAGSQGQKRLERSARITSFDSLKRTCYQQAGLADRLMPCTSADVPAGEGEGVARPADAVAHVAGKCASQARRRLGQELPAEPLREYPTQQRRHHSVDLAAGGHLRKTSRLDARDGFGDAASTAEMRAGRVQSPSTPKPERPPLARQSQRATTP